MVVGQSLWGSSVGGLALATYIQSRILPGARYKDTPQKIKQVESEETKSKSQRRFGRIRNGDWRPFPITLVTLSLVR